MTKQFTEEEVEALKELAQEKIWVKKVMLSDDDGTPYPYRNRYSKEPPHLPSEKEKEKELKRRVNKAIEGISKILK